MMNLYEEIEKIKAQGYNEANAQSKLGQDIVLKAIYDSGMARNATIKGGVVMRSISGEVRRATQDLDLDFIRYSFAEQVFIVFMNNLEYDETGVTNYKQAEYRAAQYIRSYYDPSYAVEPPFEQWEKEGDPISAGGWNH